MDAWLRFRKNRLALIGLALVLMLVLAATLAPWLALHDPTRQSLIEKRARPGAKYLLGADEFGRDILSRVIYGSRVALLVGVVSVLIALAGGLVLGTAAGFTGGWLDTVVMRVVEILLAFPYLLLALAIVAMLGPGVLNTTLAVGIWGVPAVTRMVRGSVLVLRETEYVGAARALGAPPLALLRRHIFPNVLPGLISTGRDVLLVAPHVATVPGLAIMVAVLGFNLVGDGLRDALDPRLTTTR